MAEREDQIGQNSEGSLGSKEKAEQFERWRENFVRIDQAVIESGIIPRLHELFSQREVDEGYLIFDAEEMSKGFPVPVLTRYIIPLAYSKETQNEEVDPNGLHPGFLISEILRLGGGRTVQIQTALDLEDMQKIAHRGQAVLNREGKDWDTEPYWWNYPYKATDMTRVYNSINDASYFDKNIKPAKDRLPFESFIWGNSSLDERIGLLDFEEETDGVVTKLWQDQKEDVNKAFNNLAEIIDEHLRK